MRGELQLLPLSDCHHTSPSRNRSTGIGRGRGGGGAYSKVGGVTTGRGVKGVCQAGSLRGEGSLACDVSVSTGAAVTVGEGSSAVDTSLQETHTEVHVCLSY